MCVFPFKYKGQIHTKCTKDDSQNNVYWCATGVDKDQNVVHGLWDECGQECPLEDDRRGDQSWNYLIFDIRILKDAEQDRVRNVFSHSNTKEGFTSPAQ